MPLLCNTVGSPPVYQPPVCVVRPSRSTMHSLAPEGDSQQSATMKSGTPSLDGCLRSAEACPPHLTYSVTSEHLGGATAIRGDESQLDIVADGLWGGRK